MKDFFLRRKMDSDGFLPLHLIASFQRVQNLTTNLELVMEAVGESDKLELQFEGWDDCRGCKVLFYINDDILCLTSKHAYSTCL